MMDFAQERELVHLRYELRRLMADRRPDEALPLLERLRQIAADETWEVPSLRPEIDRWTSHFGFTPSKKEVPG
jgi:hypothetical protein